MVDHQKFMLADSIQGATFTQTKFDGAMGMATGGELATPFFQNLRGKLDKDWFSIYYSNNDQQPGQITLGGRVPELSAGPVTWHPPGPHYPYFWAIELERIEVGGKTVFECPSGQGEGQG